MSRLMLNLHQIADAGLYTSHMITCQLEFALEPERSMMEMPPLIRESNLVFTTYIFLG